MEDLNTTGSKIVCALHDLVTNDNFFEEVEARLENPDERDESGYTLLHAAAWSREANCRIVQLLLERNADVDATARCEYTPLHFAVANRKRSAVAALIEAGASVNLRDVFGRTALHFAIDKTKADPPFPIPKHPCDMWIVERLLSHPEININAATNGGSTPLLWAVRGGETDAVEALLRKAADPNIPNMNNRTPLHVALSSTVAHANSRIVCGLLSKGAGIYCEDKFGLTPMDLFFRNPPANDVIDQVVMSIVLRYKIRRSLIPELMKIPRLYTYFKRCCEEVRLMKREIVYENFTLHDFACGCFHLRVENPLQDIYIPVVKILLTGSYHKYLDFILRRMTTWDLRRILKDDNPIPEIEQVLGKYSHLTIFLKIKLLGVNYSGWK